MDTAPRPVPVRSATGEGEAGALAEARAHFEGGRASTAVRLLRHFLELHPKSPLAVDARWILGRSHEELGEWHAALVQYRLILAEATRQPGLTSTMNQQVRDRVTVLTRTLGRASTSVSGFVALALDPAHFPDPAQWQQWLTPLLAEGVTTLVIDVAPVARPTVSPTERGVYFPTAWARLERDLFSELVPLAHDLGLTVMASLDLTQMPWLDPTLGWTTYVLDDSTKQLAPSLSFDLLHPSVQEYLSGFLADLAKTQIDGLIALVGSRTGVRYQVSPRGLKRFSENAGMELDPEAVLRAAKHLGGAAAKDVRPPSAAPRPGEKAATSDATKDNDRALMESVWRWAGWQARERLNVLVQLRQAMRRYRSSFHMTIAFHDVALTNSVAALVEHGEDVLEATQRGFGVAVPFAVLVPNAPAPTADAQVGAGGPSSGFSDRLTQTVEMVGSPERLWLLEPVPHLDRSAVSRLLSLPQTQQVRGRGLNLVVTAPGP
ncbi:MAG: tetratricopeptide repeat protein [Nitrospiraceae bacterium]